MLMGIGLPQFISKVCNSDSFLFSLVSIVPLTEAIKSKTSSFCSILNNYLRNKCKSQDEIPQLTLIYEEKDGNNTIHISLSRSFVLREYYIEPFYNYLKEEFKNTKPLQITLKPFKIFLNDNKTRTFFSFLCEQSVDSLLSFIHKVDSVLVRFKQMVYYNPAIPHASICSISIDISHLFDSHYLIKKEDHPSSDDLKSSTDKEEEESSSDSEASDLYHDLYSDSDSSEDENVDCLLQDQVVIDDEESLNKWIHSLHSIRFQCTSIHFISGNRFYKIPLSLFLLCFL